MLASPVKTRLKCCEKVSSWRHVKKVQKKIWHHLWDTALLDHQILSTKVQEKKRSQLGESLFWAWDWMGSHVVCQKVTGASPNSSSNPTPISSSVLNGESPSEPDTQSNVPVIKVNGRWTQRIKCYDCMDDDTLEENKPTRLTQLSVNRSWHVFVKIFPYQGSSWPF